MIILDEARKLINLGLPIIPLCPADHVNMSPRHLQICKCAGKMPLIKNWQYVNETKPEHLQDWIQQFKNFNIGISLGNCSNLCGIDVDGELGEEYLQDMSDGDLPDTWEFSTGNGRRLLYTIPIGIKTKKFKQANKEGGHEECSLLCEGQQTVLPPSIHISGKIYTWLPNKSPWDIDCAEAPDWLLNLIVSDDRTSGDKVLNEVIPLSYNPLENLLAEFICEDFDPIIPDYFTEGAEVKTQKASSSIKLTESMLNVVIPQGQRDNTMTAIIGHFCSKKELRLLGETTLISVCLDYNKKWCDPPLEDAAIIQKVKHFCELEQMKGAKYKEAAGEKKLFEASKLAALVYRVIQETKKEHVTFDQKTKMFYYTKTDYGPWVGNNDYTLISSYIREIITDPKYGCPSWDKQGYVDEVRKAYEEIHTRAFDRLDSFDIGENADKLSKYIVLKNGMLDWQNDVLYKWNSAYKTTIGFSFEYDPVATCPNFERYLAEWLPDPDIRKVIQEYLGYCLIPNTKFRKALFLHGKGKNGKSMLLEFLIKFFSEHVSCLSYDGLFSRFGPAILKDKLLNIFDDTTLTFAKDTGIIKTLISGGTLRAEYKGKNAFTFTNTARFIFSAQETPKTADTSLAWYDRWIFIKFPNQFEASNRTKTMMETNMQQEIPGIFNWMVEGLKRLMSNDGFTYSPSLIQSTREYRMQNDNVMSFILNMCKQEPGQTGTTVGTLYKYYCAWSEYEGLKPLSKKKFSERVEDAGIKKSIGYIGGKGGQTFFDGLSVNKDSEDYKENVLEYTLACQG